MESNLTSDCWNFVGRYFHSKSAYPSRLAAEACWKELDLYFLRIWTTVTCFPYQGIQGFSQSLQQSSARVYSAESVFPFNKHLCVRPCGKLRDDRKGVKTAVLWHKCQTSNADLMSARIEEGRFWSLE